MVLYYCVQTQPTKHWSKKYTKNGGVQGFSKKEIAKCGHEILNVRISSV